MTCTQLINSLSI